MLEIWTSCEVREECRSGTSGGRQGSSPVHLASFAGISEILQSLRKRCSAEDGEDVHAARNHTVDIWS